MSDAAYNPELSWLSFNWRVLAMAMDPSTPLFEKLRFLVRGHRTVPHVTLVLRPSPAAPSRPEHHAHNTRRASLPLTLPPLHPSNPDPPPVHHRPQPG